MGTRTESSDQNKSPTTPRNDSDGPDVPSMDTPSPPLSQSVTSPGSASQGLRLFHWSGSSPTSEQSGKPRSTSHMAALQQFQYQTLRDLETLSPSTTTPSSALCPPFTDGNTEHKDDLPDSPMSQDSAYFSQSQPYFTSCNKTEVPTSCQVDAASVRS